jgi:hypothetical protein
MIFAVFHAIWSLACSLVVGIFLAFRGQKSVFSSNKVNFGKKVNIRVKNTLLGCPTNRQSIVLITDKRSTYG